MYVATSQQLKRYDQALLNEGYTIEELVDKASDCLLAHFEYYQNALIICGPGNNGADGISLGIKMFEQEKDVTLCLLGSLDRLSRANQSYLNDAYDRQMNIMFLDEESLLDFEDHLDCYDVIVDAIFGFGLNSDLRGIVKQVVDMVNTVGEADVISIDLPTGLNPDTGKPYNSCICAYQTITLTALKYAFLNEETEMYTGHVILELLEAKDLHEELMLSKLVDEQWAKYHIKSRQFDGHKGTYGKIMHVTGCSNYRGAALMAAKAAVYTGSGIVNVCTNESVIDALSIFVPEATSSIRQRRINERDMQSKDAILVGSGLGLNEQSEQLVVDLIQHSTVPMVIDGDALTILSRHVELLEKHKAPIILTPHHGEFKRFVDFQNVSQMVDEANEFARKYHVTLVLKGPNTLITDGVEAYKNTTGNKTMSSAGMGDVLAGIISSLLGQGYGTKNAAILGVYLHGLCGDEIAKTQYTSIAHQIIDYIPVKMKQLCNQ